MKTVVCVVDFINGVCGFPQTPCHGYMSQHPEVLANANKIIAECRDKNVPLAFVRLAFAPDFRGLEGINSPMAGFMRDNKLCIQGTPPAEFIQGLDVTASDTVLNKQYVDPFFLSGLAEFLDSHEAERVVFIGLATELAIAQGCMTAMTRGKNYDITVVADACGGTTEAHHKMGLDIMVGRSVTNILDTQSFIRTLDAAARPVARP